MKKVAMFVSFLVGFLMSFFLVVTLSGCANEPPRGQPFQKGDPPGYRPAVGATATVRTNGTARANGAGEIAAKTRPGAPRPATDLPQPMVVGEDGEVRPIMADENGLGRMKLREEGEVTETNPLNAVEHAARKASAAARYGAAWVLLAIGIMLPGPAVIFLIPGIITGRSEKLIEGVALAGWGIFMLNLAGDAGVDALTPWVWGVLVVPGALLFLWGLFTDNEAGKFALVTGPVVVFGIYLFAQLYRMLVLGAAGSALFTFILILLVAAVLIGAASRLGGRTA